jgi:hypothetical protein
MTHGSVRRAKKQPGGRAAVSVWQRQASAWAHQLVDQAHYGERQKDTEVVIEETSLRLTKDQAMKLSEELDQVLKTWRRTVEPAEGARTYSLYLMLQPYPDVRSEGDDGADEPA